MDLTQYILLGAVLAGVTELLSRLRARDYWVATTIGSCVLVGAVCGYFKRFGAPSIEIGILAGFATSGALKGLSVLGQKSTPAPSDAVDRSR